MSKFKGNIHFAWWVLVGLCLTVGLSKAALNNSAGLFFPAITKDLGIGTGNLTLYLSISSIVTLVFLPIGGKLMSKYDTRYLLTIAIILQAGAFGIFGFSSSVWGWYIFAIPLAVGGVFTTIIAGPVIINQWFKKRNGLALGIMGASGGLLGVIVQPAVGNLINNQGWRNSYFIVAIVCLVILIPVIFFLLRNAPKDKGLLPYGQTANKPDEETKDDGSNSGISFKSARTSLAFFMLITFFFIITSISSFTVHIPNYLTSEGFSVSFAGSVMSAQMLGVFIGSLSLGYLCDRIGTKRTSLLDMVVGIVSIALLLIFTNSTVAIMVAVFLFGFVTASIGTLAPSLAKTLFGNKDYDQIYSNSSMGLAISSIIALPAYGYIFDVTGSYKIVLFIIIAMLVINIVCLMVAFRNQKKMVQKGLWQ